MLARISQWVVSRGIWQRAGFQWIARKWNSLCRIVTHSYPRLTPYERLHLSLFAVLGLLLYGYVTIRQDIDATGIALLIAFIGWFVLVYGKRRDWAFWVGLVAVVVAVGPALIVDHWDVLHDGQRDSTSTTIRNFGLLIGGAIAVILAVWRSIVAERQAGTAQQSLLNERYQKGAEMLGNNVLAVRLGGIYALERLAADQPEQYHVQVMKLLCAFARHPTEDEDYQGKLAEHNANPRNLTSPREDTMAAIEAIGSRDDTRIEIEKSQDFQPNLIGTNLSYAQIRGANLSGTMLNSANLTSASIFSVNLSGAFLRSTIMKNAELYDVDFTDAKAWNVDLSGARMEQRGKPLFDLDHANLSPIQLSNGTLSLTQILDADLSGKFIQYANLDRVQVTRSDLSGAHFLGTKLRGAVISKSNLSGAEIKRTDMAGAKIPGTDLSGTYFYDPHGGAAPSTVTGLTQTQLDEACADPDNPPKLDGVLDAETGQPLVWRGEPCKDLKSR